MKFTRLQKLLAILFLLSVYPAILLIGAFILQKQEGPSDDSEQEAIAALEKLGADGWYPANGEIVFFGLTAEEGEAMGLVHLKGLMGNQGRLNLSHTQVTDAGLVHLKGLTKLGYLDLRHTQVTDAGLVHLKGLTKLGQLCLDNTQITDAGLAHLKGLTNLFHLQLADTSITDAGLESLKGMTLLTTLNLDNTEVTDDGVAELQKGIFKERTRLHYSGDVRHRLERPPVTITR